MFSHIYVEDSYKSDAIYISKSGLLEETEGKGKE
jgi:hypothetical protein